MQLRLISLFLLLLTSMSCIGLILGQRTTTTESYNQTKIAIFATNTQVQAYINGTATAKAAAQASGPNGAVTALAATIVQLQATIAQLETKTGFLAIATTSSNYSQTGQAILATNTQVQAFINGTS